MQEYGLTQTASASNAIESKSSSVMPDFAGFLAPEVAL